LPYGCPACPELGRWILAAVPLSWAQTWLARAGESLPAATTRPGLAISATEDQFLPSLQSRQQADEKANARALELDGLTHWWTLEDPARNFLSLTCSAASRASAFAATVGASSRGRTALRRRRPRSRHRVGRWCRRPRRARSPSRGRPSRCPAPRPLSTR